MKSLPNIAYWDIVALVLAITLPLKLFIQRKYKNEDITETNEGFAEDNVITRIEDDHFMRKVAASEISRLIQLTPNKKSFAIGILGEYGSGKTSFLNLINLNLEDDKVLKIPFNPWSASSPETIRREFFDLLASEIARVDSKISSLIYSYGRRVAGIDNRSIYWMNWVGFFRSGDSGQNSGEYETINKMLAATGRKIVVAIDDLDRLYPAEIMEVLKLIRNTANFSNVFYLVGYDKAYVQRALKSLNNTELDYLDKIFQLEIPLPKREEDDLLTALRTYLKDIVSEEHYSTFEDVLIPNGFRSRYDKGYKGVLRQGRDVIRFTNGFKIIYRLIGKEVDFECLFVLELIKFRFPSIYDLIYTQSDQFLYENAVRSTHEQHFVPRVIKSGETKTTSNDVTVFVTYIEKIDSLSQEDILLLDGLFRTLFNGSQYHYPKTRNSISYPLYFEIYFRYRLSQKDLSDKDYKAAIVSGQMQEYMKECASNGLHKELMVRLMQEDISKDRAHFENVISWIFSFGRTFVAIEGMFRFDYQGLADKIYNYHNVITDKFYKKDKSAYVTFIDHLFRTAQAPYLFENELLFLIKKQHGDFVLSNSKMIVHQLSYFTDMAESGHGLSEDTLWLFWGARENYRVPVDDKGGFQERWHFEPELAKKMKLYLASKDPKEFLKFSLERDIRESTFCFISNHVIEIFNDPAEYRKLVEENPELEDEIRKEYLELIDKLAAKEFKEYVEMDFKTELKKTEAS